MNDTSTPVVQRRLRLASSDAIDSKSLQALAGSPGMLRSDQDGAWLNLYYDLGQTSLERLFESLAEHGIELSERLPHRLRHALLVYGDHNRHDQLTAPAGWSAWLRAMYLTGDADRPRARTGGSLRRPLLWRRYVERDNKA